MNHHCDPIVRSRPHTRTKARLYARSPRPGLAKRIVQYPINSLKPFPKNPRRHPEQQIIALMKGIEQCWTVPILIDETGTILCGHARWEAAKRLNMTLVPTLTVLGLNENQKKALVISDNRLPEQALWDNGLLREYFQELTELKFDVQLTGFATGEIDLILDGKPEDESADPADDLSRLLTNAPAVCRQGDLWHLGPHRLICDDALKAETYERLLGNEAAQLIVADPPYNVRIQGHAMGRGKTRHREFIMGSGEMSSAQFGGFLEKFMRQAVSFSQDGSIHYVFMDWRHQYELLSAAQEYYTEQKALLVWNKTNAGQGSFYRSKHELIFVFKNGTGPHINNFGLGGKGRYRTNVLDCPSVNCLHPARRGDLELHPTVKPVALIADLIRDCSHRNGIVLDPFVGSGTTILASQRTGRIARTVELDPLYADIALRRWEQLTKSPARHAATNQTFAEMARHRGVDETPRRRGKPGN